MEAVHNDRDRNIDTSGGITLRKFPVLACLTEEFKVDDDGRPSRRLAQVQESSADAKVNGIRTDRQENETTADKETT